MSQPQPGDRVRVVDYDGQGQFIGNATIQTVDTFESLEDRHWHDEWSTILVFDGESGATSRWIRERDIIQKGKA